MQEITVAELKQMMQNGQSFQLIDVREPHEYEMYNIGGELIPLAEAVTAEERINKEIPVVLYCRSGARSATAIMQLEKNFGFINLYNLKGGILAWEKENN